MTIAGESIDRDKKTVWRLILKIVVCGTYGDMKHFNEVLKHFRGKYGEQNVFPDADHLERSRPCIEAHHEGKCETAETVKIRSELMKMYFSQIDKADLIVIVNEKKGREYYGVGTTIELGYAFAKDKRIHFTMKPTNPNILSLLTTKANSFDM